MARHFGIPPNNGRPRIDDDHPVLPVVNTEAPLDNAGERGRDDEPVNPARDANHGFCRIVIGVALACGGVIVCLIMLAYAVFARDLDGRYANTPLKAWFDSLGSGKGMCCSFADGISIRDVDWDMRGDRYWVRIGNTWVEVPDDALVKVPNKFGPAVVWPYQDADGVTQIRCFLPGAGA